MSDYDDAVAHVRATRPNVRFPEALVSGMEPQEVAELAAKARGEKPPVHARSGVDPNHDKCPHGVALHLPVGSCYKCPEDGWIETGPYKQFKYAVFYAIQNNYDFPRAYVAQMRLSDPERYSIEARKGYSIAKQVQEEDNEDA